MAIKSNKSTKSKGKYFIFLLVALYGVYYWFKNRSTKNVTVLNNTTHTTEDVNTNVATTTVLNDDGSVTTSTQPLMTYSECKSEKYDKWLIHNPKPPVKIPCSSSELGCIGGQKLNPLHLYWSSEEAKILREISQECSQYL